MKRAILTLASLLLALTLTLACSLPGDDKDNDNDGATPAASQAGRTPTTAASSASPTTIRSAASRTATPEATRTPSRATATPSNDASPTTSANTDATATAGGSTPDTSEAAVEAELEEVEADIAEVRGLQLKEDVQSDIISREQLSENLMAMLEEDYPREDADDDTIILWLLRLIDDPDMDIFQLYVDLYSERVLGYYDQEADELFLVSDEEGLSGLAEITMAHELTHALQDQHYDLTTLRPEDMPADQALAITALFEGDAEVASMRYALEKMTPEELTDAVMESATISSDVIDRAPAYIREGLYFPYVQGTEFVTALLNEGGFDAVNAAYANPPASSEQILHPEKFIDQRDDPTDVDLPDLSGALGDGWSESREDTLGEFDFQIMLRENGVITYEEASAGWDGSSYALYERGDDALVITSAVWDSPADADEFEAALREMLAGNSNIQPADGVWSDGAGRYSALARHDDGRVTLIASTNRDAAVAALAAAGE